MVAAAACSSDKASETTTQNKPPPKTTAKGDAAVVAVPKAPIVTSPIAQAGQLVVVVSKAWAESSVEIHRFAKGPGGWARVGSSVSAEIGHTGLGWGIGLHGVGAPDGREGPTKKEGDGRSPAGAFSLGSSFGYAKAAPTGTQIAYTQLDKSWRCVDDPSSRYYNDVLPQSSADKVDWKSAETMRRADELYRWVVLVDHNSIRADGQKRASEPTPGAGSCIFFHVWRAPGGATVGCAAMDRGNLEELMGWLDPAMNPVTVMLPRSEYEALEKSWALPPL